MARRPKTLLDLWTPMFQRELFRLLRLIVVLVCVCVLGIPLIGAIERMVAQKNSWLEFLTWVLSFAGPTLIYLIHEWWLRRGFRRVNQERQDRIIVLEQKVDPGRTTSGVNRDGTSELDR